MVCTEICPQRKYSLLFKAQEVNINKQAYRSDILESVVLSRDKQHFRNQKRRSTRQI